MDVLNLSQRHLLVVGQSDIDLVAVIESCCLLPEPFYPTQITWMVGEPSTAAVTSQLQQARYHCSDSLNSALSDVSIEVDGLADCRQRLLGLFKQAVVNCHSQLMVVCFRHDAVLLAELIPLFCSFSRACDSLMIALEKPSYSCCSLQPVALPASYYAASGEPLRLSDDELNLRMAQWLAPAPLIIQPDDQHLIIDQQVIGLSPLLFAFYFWLARRRKQCQQQILPNGGMVRYDQPAVAREFLAVYRHYCDDLSSHYEKAQFLLKEKFPKNYFLEKVSLIRSSLREVLGSRADQYLVHGVGKRNEMVHGLLLPPELIRFER